MNSKQITIITVATCSLTALLAGCCCPGKPKPIDEIPQITMQPPDTDVTTNKDTSLTVEIQRENNDNYRFDWFREVQVPTCPENSSVTAFTFQLQTNRPGWNTARLRIENASTNDQGNYFCLISHELNRVPPEEAQTRTRPAFLRVIQASSFHPLNVTNTMTGNLQVVSSPILGGQQINTPTCGLASYNGSKTFRVDDHGLPFKNPTATTCVLTVSQMVNGVLTPLNNTQFTVRVYPPAPTQPFCSTATPGNAQQRQFPAAASTAYQFVVYLVNANGAIYQLNVLFQ